MIRFPVYIKKGLKYCMILLSLFLILEGCQKFEEFKESETVYYNSEENMTELITGAYDRFKYIFINISTDEEGTSYHWEWYQMPNSFGDDFNHSVLNYGFYELQDNRFEYNCSDESSSVRLYNYGEISETWYDCYKTITALNNIIVHAEEQGGLIPEVKEILGEAYFLRGYIYFRLARIYGEIPLIKDTEVSYTVSNASFEEIYDFMEQDLKSAIELLPANSNEARVPYSTPHIGTAKAILSEVYLTRGGYPLKQTEYYTKAAEVSGNVIDSASYYGFEILPDFAELWDNQILWNKETVFAMNYTKSSYNIPWEWITSNNEDYFVLGTIIPESGVSNGTGIKFYNTFPKSYRKTMTFYSLFVEPYSTNSIFNYNFLVISEPVQMDLCTPVYYNKFDLRWKFSTASTWNPFNSGQTRSFQKISDNFNLYIYRFAQTVLTFAEAKARSGQLDEQSYEAVNIIRRRAHHVDLYSPSVYDLTPGLSVQQFTDSVVWERAWELCAEPEGRWFDLVRLEMVEDMSSLRDENDRLDYPDIITKDFYFLPIPESEIELNPNLE